MAETLGELKLVLLLEFGKLVGQTKEVKGHLQKVETQVRTTGASGERAFSGFVKQMGLGIFTAGSLVLALKKIGTIAIQEFLEADKVATQLGFAWRGDADSLERLIQFAEQWADKTIFDDDDILKAEAFLATQRRTEDQIKKITIASMNLQAVKGGDLLTWVEQLDGMLETGLIPRSLIKIDKSFKDLSITQIKNGKAVDIINDKYKDFAEKMATSYSGKIQMGWNKIRNSFGDGVASIIKLINKLPSLGNEILRFFASLADKIELAGKRMQEAFSQIPIFGKPMEWLGSGLEKVAGDFSTSFGETVKQFDLEEKVMGTINKVKEKIDQMKREREEAGDDFEKTVGKGNEEIKEEKDLLNELINQLEIQSKLYEYTEGLQGKSLDQIKQILQESENIVTTDEQRVKYLEYIKELNEKIAEKMKEQKAIAVEVIPPGGKGAPLTGHTGTGEPSQAEAFKPDEGAWIQHWITGVNFATLIVNILNQRPENLLQAFQMIFLLAQQIATLMGLASGGVFFGAIAGLFSVLGAIGGTSGGLKPSGGLGIGGMSYFGSSISGSPMITVIFDQKIKPLTAEDTIDVVVTGLPGANVRLKRLRH